DMADFLDLMDKVLHEGAPGGIFNVSTGIGHSIKEVLEAVTAHLGIEQIMPVPVVPVGVDDIPAVVLDPVRTRSLFGWEAEVDFSEAVRRVLCWYDAHGVSVTYSHLRAAPGALP